MNFSSDNLHLEVYAHLVKAGCVDSAPARCSLSRSRSSSSSIVKLHLDDDLEDARYWAASRLEDTLEQVIGHVARRWDSAISQWDTRRQNHRKTVLNGAQPLFLTLFSCPDGVRLARANPDKLGQPALAKDGMGHG